MSFRKGTRVRMRKGWLRSANDPLDLQGVVLAQPVFVQQWWTPVLWNDNEDPDFCKTDGLERVAK